jgi:hypothetical protein
MIGGAAQIVSTVRPSLHLNVQKLRDKDVSIKGTTIRLDTVISIQYGYFVALLD